MKTNHCDIIARFGYTTEYGRAMGLNENTAKRHWQRGRIPPDHWPRLLEICRARGWYDVTAESLLAGLEPTVCQIRRGVGNGMAAASPAA